jgi:enoyl-CoA hydratase/carnithine racemase
MGLVNRLFPAEVLMDETLKYAVDLATNVSPRSMRVMKAQLWESPHQTLAEAVTLANREMFDSIQSDDFTEGVRHFIEKRPARFSGR